ncbi:uncharacterized protein LOC121755795 [Salvia splendens]|uniref:uncharacterized protein LOC121755795 n=1 Tax=Salvia splendens TaxID=180675 RepID=UPI001C2596D7|nr:uncharacterized protein LOC121755795 [Salvia splendens]XP_042007120.1 uncharacterized protein LOC121755795 [Salvia splendens]XP_042007121.1 uncharacterized protein LOC121755795 [Salvia splendens]XP_042007122.1 uncharacterized protein LOC121755795 [Salvia splendens]XP_042007123.1 uncharacterized protein LOC121755795 [Salvia splendens]XP_042007124.1 uncharacterized protein LOC121755795 [Salvia splendens]
MDFKGVAWAGDIYEKFEAMCLEVEEIMYEDTVKYVENQAQKVGVSVKKLYEEVMQDLLLPSRLGPVPPPETDINEKPNPAISEINNKQAVVEENICNSTPQDSTPNVRVDDAKGLSPTPHRVLVETTQSEECCGESRRAGPTRRPIGIKRISQPPEAPRPVSSLCETQSNYFVVNDDLVTASPELFARQDPSKAAAKSRPISDASPEPCNSNQILSAESVKLDDGATPAPIDMFREDGSLSRTNSNITETCHVGSAGEEATASYEDNFDIEVIDPTEKSRLDESCVLVEGNDDELHFVSRGSKKHKSYKKKIYNVLSSKLRSTKKRDLCVSGHEDLSDCVSGHEDLSDNNEAGVKSSALVMDSNERKLAAESSSDFGWELL